MAKERPPLEEMTLRQLRRVASEYSVSRYSRMRKSQLLAAIQSAQSRYRTVVPNPSPASEVQEVMEATKFELGSVDASEANLASVDADLPELPGGYGDSRIVLLPRDPQWAYAYWDIPNEHREELRARGGQQLALRLYDASAEATHSVQEYPADELAREWYLPLPASDRDYAVEIGYRCGDGRWLVLARSAPVHAPPMYPSDWVADRFATVDWERSLGQDSGLDLAAPARRESDRLDCELYEAIQSFEARRIAGSLYEGLSSSTPSSHLFPSGAGLWISGAEGREWASDPHLWLVADAELTVYGTTDPDATLTIDGRPVPLAADGSFQFQVSLQEGQFDYPIVATSDDGGQNAMRIHFEGEPRRESQQHRRS